jgi:hypothetical protein
MFRLVWRLGWPAILAMAGHGPEFIPPPGRKPEDEPPKETPLGGPPPRERMTVPEIITLVVTNCVKLAGVVVILIGVTRKDITPIVLLIGGFMVAGGQGAENLIGSMFGRPGEKK